MDTLEGRTVVVTGATTGIGKVAAHALAAMGADLIVVARDEAKAKSTVAEIERASPKAKVEFVRCDFSSLASIRKAGSELRSRRQKIHVLLNNAGAVNTV